MCGLVAVRRRVASMPFEAGHLQVHQHHIRLESAPRAPPPRRRGASPTTAMSGCAASRPRSPVRKSGLSSAIRMRIGSGVRHAVTHHCRRRRGDMARWRVPASRRPGAARSCSVPPSSVGALAHRVQPDAGVPIRRRAAAVVRDRPGSQRRRVEREADGAVGARGMAHDIGQRLLGDAVGGHLDRGRQRRQRSGPRR